jgi:hypothetical protein
LEEEYVLTQNKSIGGDCVPFEEIQLYMESKGFTEGRTKLIQELNALGLPSTVKKINRKAVQVRLGIRRAENGEEEGAVSVVVSNGGAIVMENSVSDVKVIFRIYLFLIGYKYILTTLTTLT